MSSDKEIAALSSCLQDAFVSYKKADDEQQKNFEVKHYYGCFPRKFETFKSIFGYTEAGGHTKYGPLYGGEPNILTEILPIVGPKTGMQKYVDLLIDVSLDGYWQADGGQHTPAIGNQRAKK